MPDTKSALFESLFNAVRLRLLFHGKVVGPVSWSSAKGDPMNRLSFFTKGKAQVRSGTQTYELSAGRIYLFPLNRPYHFQGPGNFEKVFFDFRAEIFPGWDLFEPTASGASLPMEQVPQAKRLMACFHKNSVEALMEATGLLWQILARFVTLTPAAFREKTLLSSRYAFLRTVVEGRPHRKIKLGPVAAAMGLSLSNFSRKFKADTGINLDRYIAHEFIERAKIQLLLTDFKIREIADDLGFSNEFYFSRFFKRHTGFAPRPYRASHPWMQGAVPGREPPSRHRSESLAAGFGDLPRSPKNE